MNDGLTVLEMLIMDSIITRGEASERDIIGDLANSTAASEQEIREAIHELYRRAVIERNYDGTYEEPIW